MRHKPFALTPRGVLGWVLSQHPPSNFSLFIVVSRDLGGCWGIFREKLYILHSAFYSKTFCIFAPAICPFICLTDNGFRDYYKPSGTLFDACAAGRVLILSPWQYDADKRHISRADCVALNEMAEEISSIC